MCKDARSPPPPPGLDSHISRRRKCREKQRQRQAVWAEPNMQSHLPGGGSRYLDVENLFKESNSCWIVLNLTRFLWSSPLFSPWQSHCSTGLYLLVTVNGCLEEQCSWLNFDWFNFDGLTCRAHMCRTGKRTTTSPGSCGGQLRPSGKVWLYPDNHQLTNRSRATAGGQERFHEVSFMANPTKYPSRAFSRQFFLRNSE